MTRLKELKTGPKFSEFPPNSLQFRALCLAFYEDLGLPKASDAYSEIKSRVYTTNPNWSHKVVQFIAKRLPENFLAIEQEHVSYALFKKAYDQVCDLVKQGHALPEIKEPVMAQKPRNKVLARNYLQQIRQQLGA